MLDMGKDPMKPKKCEEEYKRRTTEYKEESVLPADLEPHIDLRWTE